VSNDEGGNACSACKSPGQRRVLILFTPLRWKVRVLGARSSAHLLELTNVRAHWIGSMCVGQLTPLVRFSKRFGANDSSGKHTTWLVL